MKIQNVGVAGFLYHEGKVLVVRRAPHETMFAGYYELPGGGVEFGEEPDTAIVREFKEETNLDVEMIAPYMTFSYVTKNDTVHTVEVVYLVKLVGDINTLRLSDEHDDYRWISQEEVDTLTISPEVKRNIHEGFQKIQNAF
ncbi:MAG: NUDIX domain-containing protein [Candidatus Woesearchaeota archaeon]